MDRNDIGERERVTDESTQTNRRTMLKATGATAAVVTGLAATSGSATATEVDEFDLSGFGAADELPHSDESELVIYLHGGGVSSTAASQGGSLEEGLSDAGYETTVIAGVFDTGSVGILEETSEEADTLAALIEDYYDSTGGSIRIVGYSLGGILTMQTLEALGDDYTVETAASLGTGTPDDSVCEGGAYHDGIAANTEEFRVLYSEDDTAVQTMDAMEPDCGGFWSDGSPPDTLTRVDVTHDVDDHMSYLQSDAVMDDLVESFGGGDGNDGDGDDGDDDDSGWFDGGFGWF